MHGVAEYMYNKAKDYDLDPEIQCDTIYNRLMKLKIEQRGE